MMRRFMEAALKKTRQGMKRGNSPFGACIVKGNGIVSVAHNTVLEKHDSTNHAEMNAIRLACKKLKTHDLRGCTIYSTTEPCPMCFSAIHWAGIRSIAYGTNINDVKRLGFSELTISNEQMNKKGGAKIKIKKDFMRDECLQLLRDWKKGGGGVY
jgi:tRNA(Arg) A34 adenosine deaminase TadA